MVRETSKLNIQKAQDSRRLIGVVKFLDKLVLYAGNTELWNKIVELFDHHGFQLKRK